MADPSPIRLRLPLGGGVAFGPGKAELMERVRATGSLSAAAQGMGMSYRRAWSLVGEVNRAFRAPLVLLSRGGAAGGGARLSEEGEAVLAHYRAMEALALREGAGHLDAIRALLADMSDRK